MSCGRGQLFFLPQVRRASVLDYLRGAEEDILLYCSVDIIFSVDVADLMQQNLQGLFDHFEYLLV